MEEGLIGAIIGGLLTGGAQYLSEHLKMRASKRNLVVALGAEASAVAEVVRRRLWLEHLVDLAALARDEGCVHQFSVHLPAELITCTRAAAANAGMLSGRLPSLVARLVMMTDGAAADIRRLADFPIDDERGFLRSGDPDGAFNVYAELNAMIAEVLWTCDMIVLEAKEHYPTETAGLSAGHPSQVELGYRRAQVTAAEQLEQRQSVPGIH